MDPTNALNAHASQAFGADGYPPTEPGPSLPPSPGAPPPPGVHSVPDAPPAPVAPVATQGAAPPPPSSPAATAATHSLVATASEQCPSCGTHIAPDQRYCLACGARCGEPRLPIMDAVTFMDSMKQPRDASAPPPQRPQRRVSSNMALFATIGVLLLAMGVGVLIGRSGNHSVATAPQAAPIVINKGSGAEESGTASNEGASGTGAIGGSSKKEKPKKLKAEAESGKGAEEILHYAPGVKPPEPKVEVGDKCEEGTAGCKNGKFEGSFFE
jgi:hypothetical protein